MTVSSIQLSEVISEFVELNDLWDIVDEYFDELDDDVRGFYKDKMEILELRIATLMKLTSIHG